MEIAPELITRCIKGDQKAESELYHLCYSFLMSICRRYIRQEERAREVLNGGFYRILTNLGKYQPHAPISFWMRRVMINTIINEYRKEKIHYGNFTYVETYHENGDYSDINDALRKFDVQRIWSYIERLPPASRQVFNLYFIDGLKHAEIASLLKISEGTSKWHLSAAREKLKQMLADVIIEKKIINEQC
jgi:RNA polymerase sigma factor (sigma-70 family)